MTDEIKTKSATNELINNDNGRIARGSSLKLNNIKISDYS